jgi:site-specific DNA-cytosine methylase
VRFGSVFSGIGGLDLGFERAGMHCAWQIENNPFCQLALRKHWPETWKFLDVKEVNTRLLPQVDMVVGGPPCQSTSTAGRRKGERDDRWLWPEFVRIVAGVKPRWAVAENPLGLLSNPSSARIPEMLDEAGYEVLDPIEVGSGLVGGVDHRKRIFLVAHAKGWGREAGAIEHEEASREGERIGQEAGLDVVGCSPVRWPARPGDPQWIWEDRRSVEPSMVPPVDGFPARLARRWRREAHVAVGNAVNVKVAEVIGRCLLAADRMIQSSPKPSAPGL